MNSLIIAMALVAQTYGGNMSVVENLSDHDCAEAMCVAKSGASCEEVAAEDKARAARYAEYAAHQQALQEAWEKTHPKTAASCKAEGVWSWPSSCGPKYDLTMVGGGMRVDQPGDIKAAVCVK